MDRSPRPQSKTLDPKKGGRKQPQQQIPKRNLLGPGGDPAEGPRNVGAPPKK